MYVRVGKSNETYLYYPLEERKIYAWTYYKKNKTKKMYFIGKISMSFEIVFSTI